MGWRFRKRIKLLPGIKLNVSKSGISLNAGVRGASITIGKSGIYSNIGIPGTGIYSREKIKGLKYGRVAANPTKETINNTPDKPTEFELDTNGCDELIIEAANIILSHNNPSPALLRASLDIGYARTMSIMEQLEQKGVISEATSKGRKILINATKIITKQ